MPRNFYSGSELELSAGAVNLLDIVSPLPATFGLLPADITSYTTASTNFTDLLTIARAPSTRTPVAIGNKNIAKKSLRAATIDIARKITAVPTVTNAQLLSLGLNERVVPTPRPVPSDAPVVEFVSISGRVVTVRIHGGSSESRAKPFGATGACVYSFIGPEAPTDPREYHFEGTATRGKTQIVFPNSVADGAVIWVSAQWVSARGQLSVGSVPIRFTLQGGLIPAAA